MRVFRQFKQNLDFEALRQMPRRLGLLRQLLTGGFMTIYYRRRFVLVFFAVASLLLFPAMLGAQVEKRVVFAKGRSSATYRGKLPRNYADYDAYFFRAKRGQTLTVKLTTADPGAYLAIYETKQQLGPDEDMISAGEEYPHDWSGKLPVTSEYSVQIYGVSDSDKHSTGAAYSIEITIH
jgi:hypothetical protein